MNSTVKWFTDLMGDPNLEQKLKVKTEEEIRADNRNMTAIQFAYNLRTFLSVLAENPDLKFGADGTQTTLSEFVGFLASANGVKFLTDFQIATKGTLHLKADRHARLDSGGDKVPGRNYLNSVFLNTEFENGEPVFPKHVPYAMRQTTARVASKMRKKLRAGCGCGGRCGGH